MRKIKFRAWNSEYKEIMDSDLLEEMLVNGDLDIDLTNGEFTLGSPYSGEKYVLLQSTGLTDSNDIEIYEGDILEDFIEQQRYEVIWDDYGMFLFNPVGTEGNAIDYYEFEDETSSATIVIGNIYENPKLLKETSTIGEESK